MSALKCLCTESLVSHLLQACRDAQDAKRDIQVSLLSSLATIINCAPTVLGSYRFATSSKTRGWLCNTVSNDWTPFFQLLDIYSEIALILFIASIVGALSIRMKQPLIVGFIAVGILLGPATLGWVNTNDQINLLAKLGISLLLFIVGLKLDRHGDIQRFKMIKIQRQRN